MENAMPCNVCQNPTLCTERCHAYAEQLKACEASGQMTAQEVSAHVEAGELPAKVPRVGPEGWKRLAESQQALIEVDQRIRDISERYGLDAGREAGEMEAANGDES